MELKYNVTGANRKALVDAIAEITGADKKYLGAPTFAYEVDYFTIDKNGTVCFDDRADSEEIENLIEELYERGFKAEDMEMAEIDIAGYDEGDPEPIGFALGIPIDTITDIPYSEDILERLKAIVASKKTLLKKAIGTEQELLTYEKDGAIWFDWFDRPYSEDIEIYIDFFKAIYKMAAEAKRVTAKEKTVENEKFTMRTFLIRLGFIGDEFKTLRKAFMKNLDGNSAFRYGKPE
nr:MAG TPA: Putative amidoligase enzyme [Caudoviricetes sp.]